MQQTNMLNINQRKENGTDKLVQTRFMSLTHKIIFSTLSNAQG